MKLKAFWKKLIAIAALLLAAGVASPQNQTARFLFEDAEAAFARQDYRTALKRLDEAEARFGRINPPILYLRIMVHNEMLGDRPTQNMDLLDRLREETEQFLRDYGDLEQVRDQARDVFRISNRLKEMPTREQLAQRRRQEEARREAERVRRLEELAERRKPGHTSQDCPDCPQMIVVPAGKFMMGATDADPADWAFARPVHEVAVDSFEIGRYEVTQAQWKWVMGTYRPGPTLKNCMECPAHFLSWDDAQEFVRKLNQRTQSNYRLPTEAEWEYVARAGGTTRYSWGDDVGKNRANCNGCGNETDGIFSATLNAVGTFEPNPYGVFDMHGNAAEWVEDTYQPNYSGAPADGSAWKGPSATGKNDLRIVRGGHFLIKPAGISASYRQEYPRDSHGGAMVGLRVARSLR